MTVTIPYDPFDWKPLAWAKQHCPSYITNFSYNTATIDYCFGNEKEALMFLPKWPYWVQPQYYSVTEMYNIEMWVRATFGDILWADEGRWVGSDRKYWFCNEGDRTLFLLKWA
jgi:hypothetical protein